jgi:enoyl-[acyl-carrier-protein] reductase (NADH)
MRNAIGRPVRALEIAQLVAFLASDQAAAITGETLAISGGAGSGVVL